MKKVALLALVAVLAFVFVGCATEHDWDPRNDPNLIPKYISASVSSAELNVDKTDTDPQYRHGLATTNVVFSWSGVRSEPILVMGDQSQKLTAGLECSMELVSWNNDGSGKCARTYRFTYEGLGYLVTFAK